MVVYIPGNHDEFAREYVDSVFGGITVKSRTLHEMLDGRKLLVLHGDEFDGINRNRPVPAHIGHIVHEKNIGFLLEMLCAVHSQVPDVLQVIAGEGCTGGRRNDAGFFQRGDPPATG